MTQLPRRQTSRKRKQRQQASQASNSARQTETAYKDASVPSDSRTGEPRAQCSINSSYIRYENQHSSASDSRESRNTSIAKHRSSSKQQEYRLIESRRTNVQDDDRASAKKAIEDVQPRTHRGSSKLPTTTFQHVGGVPMTRTSVPMAMAAKEGQDAQDLASIGAQFSWINWTPMESSIDLTSWA